MLCLSSYVQRTVSKWCVCLWCVSVVEVSGQASLPCLVFEAYGFGGSGFGDRVSCRLALNRVLTSLVKTPRIFRGVQL